MCLSLDKCYVKDLWKHTEAECVARQLTKGRGRSLCALNPRFSRIFMWPKLHANLAVSPGPRPHCDHRFCTHTRLAAPGTVRSTHPKGKRGDFRHTCKYTQLFTAYYDHLWRCGVNVVSVSLQWLASAKLTHISLLLCVHQLAPFYGHIITQFKILIRWLVNVRLSASVRWVFIYYCVLLQLQVGVATMKWMVVHITTNSVDVYVPASKCSLIFH